MSLVISQWLTVFSRRCLTTFFGRRCQIQFQFHEFNLGRFQLTHLKWGKRQLESLDSKEGSGEDLPVK